MKKHAVLVMMLTLVLVACATIEESIGSGKCPSWAGYPPESRCKIKIWKAGEGSWRDVDFEDFEKIRITFIKSEILIDKAENLVVYQDSGKEVDYKNQRLAPATYIFEKVNAKRSTRFRIVNPHSDKVVTISAEFVRREGEEKD